MYLRHHDDVENPTIKMALLLLPMVDPDQQKKKEVVFNLFRAALRTGDPQTVADFMASHCLSNCCSHDDGICERIVLEEAMMMMPGEPTTTSSSSSMQQQMIFQHFFRELGGRFMVSPRFNVCVFSLLIQIDQARWISPLPAPDDENDAKRWAARMAEVVRYLVEDLHMPHDNHQLFRLHAHREGRSGTLMQLAFDVGAWSAYCAFGQCSSSSSDEQPISKNSFHLLQRVLASTPRTMAYWVRRFGIRTLSDDALHRLIHRRMDLYQSKAQELLTAEVQLRTQERVHMRALMMMQARDNNNALAREVLESADIGRLIHKLAWKDARC